MDACYRALREPYGGAASRFRHVRCENRQRRVVWIAINGTECEVRLGERSDVNECAK
jgi:hypothetical protein